MEEISLRPGRVDIVRGCFEMEMAHMRKGADSSRRPSTNHSSRDMRYTRRRDTVWLVPQTTSALTTGGQPHQTAGALALNPSAINPDVESTARRCALIVERDPALAQALARALRASFEPAWSVRHVSDGRLLVPLPPEETPEVIILDASWPDDDGAENCVRSSDLPGLRGAQLIFVTAGTSYQLSQRGVRSGVVLREWRNLDDIVAVVAEAIAGDKNDI